MFVGQADFLMRLLRSAAATGPSSPGVDAAAGEGDLVRMRQQVRAGAGDEGGRCGRPVIATRTAAGTIAASSVPWPVSPGIWGGRPSCSASSARSHISEAHAAGSKEKKLPALPQADRIASSKRVLDQLVIYGIAFISASI